MEVFVQTILTGAKQICYVAILDTNMATGPADQKTINYYLSQFSHNFLPFNQFSFRKFIFVRCQIFIVSYGRS
jgi:hypothetical protein